MQIRELFSGKEADGKLVAEEKLCEICRRIGDNKATDLHDFPNEGLKRVLSRITSQNGLPCT